MEKHRSEYSEGTGKVVGDGGSPANKQSGTGLGVVIIGLPFQVKTCMIQGR